MTRRLNRSLLKHYVPSQAGRGDRSLRHSRESWNRLLSSASQKRWTPAFAIDGEAMAMLRSIQFSVIEPRRACLVALLGADGAFDRRAHYWSAAAGRRLLPMVADLIGAPRTRSGRLRARQLHRVRAARRRPRPRHWAGGCRSPLFSLALIAAGARARPRRRAAGRHGELFVQIYAVDPIAPLASSPRRPDGAAAASLPISCGLDSPRPWSRRAQGRWADLCPAPRCLTLRSGAALRPSGRSTAARPTRSRLSDDRPDVSAKAAMPSRTGDGGHDSSFDPRSARPGPITQSPACCPAGSG